MKDYEKEAIIGYLNLISDEMLELKEKANDLDNQITENMFNYKKLADLMSERAPISRRMAKMHKRIHNMIGYVAADGYEIIWKDYKVVEIVERKNNEE